MRPCQSCGGRLDGMPGQEGQVCRSCVAEARRHTTGYEIHSEDRKSFLCRNVRGDGWEGWFQAYLVVRRWTRKEVREILRSLKADPALLDAYLVMTS